MAFKNYDFENFPRPFILVQLFHHKLTLLGEGFKSPNQGRWGQVVGPQAPQFKKEKRGDPVTLPNNDKRSKTSNTTILVQ